jgi:COP9 signalosome complex subunit 7
MPTIRDLEDLIIDAIYLDILRGKLDQKEQQLEVEYTMGRDLAPGKIENLLAALKDWYVTRSCFFIPCANLSANRLGRATTTSAVLLTLDRELSSISLDSTAMKSYHEEHERVLNANLKDVVERQKDKGGMGVVRRGYGSSQGQGGGSGDKDSMDVDEPLDNSKGKNRKCVDLP